MQQQVRNYRGQDRAAGRRPHPRPSAEISQPVAGQYLNGLSGGVRRSRMVDIADNVIATHDSCQPNSRADECQHVDGRGAAPERARPRGHRLADFHGRVGGAVQNQHGQADHSAQQCERMQ